MKKDCCEYECNLSFDICLNWIRRFACVTEMVLSQNLQYDTRYSCTCATTVTETSPIDYSLFGHVTLVQERYVKLDNGVAIDQQMLRQLYLHYNAHRTSNLQYENMRET